jgi:hypothetical protein
MKGKAPSAFTQACRKTLCFVAEPGQDLVFHFAWNNALMASQVMLCISLGKTSLDSAAFLYASA